MNESIPSSAHPPHAAQKPRIWFRVSWFHKSLKSSRAMLENIEGDSAHLVFWRCRWPRKPRSTWDPPAAGECHTATYRQLVKNPHGERCGRSQGATLTQDHPRSVESPIRLSNSPRTRLPSSTEANGSSAASPKSVTVLLSSPRTVGRAEHKIWRAYNAAPGSDWWTTFYPADNMQRPTGPLCDGCHSVNYNIQTKTVTEWNVGCEKCHGPGSAHANAPSKANIVNPARLEFAARQRRLHPVPIPRVSP